MTTLGIKVGGIDELRRRLDPARFDAVLARGLAAAAIHLQGEVKERTPTRTGQLRASITKKGSGLRYEVGTRVKYARYVEEDTRPHEILPRTKQALAWPGGGGSAAGLGRGPQGTLKKGGFLIVRKRVHHPGTKGVHMFEHGLRENVDAIKRIISAQIERALGGKA